MPVVGHQDFWVVGARLYFQKEQASGGNPNPVLDLGVISSANPSITPEIIQLFDSDNGSRVVVDEAVTEMNEVYEVQVRNFNLQNLSFLFLANDPEEFTQTAQHLLVTHYQHPGHLVKVTDAVGVPAFGLGSVSAVATTAGTKFVHAVTDVTLTTIVLNASEGDVTAEYVAGDYFALQGTGLSDLLNARTYKVLSSSFDATKTTITLDTTYAAPNSAEASISGLTYTNDTGATIYIQDTDWEIASLERGRIRIMPGGAISSAANVVLAVSYGAISGTRMIKPQSNKAPVKGTAWLFLSRENFGRQTVREMEVSLAPSATNLTAEEFSDMTLTVTVISDLRQDDVAGRLLDFKGTLPSLSSLQQID